jgi:GAF domain-containing protein
MSEEANAERMAALAQARDTIAGQAREIHRLREALRLAATAGIIGSPVTHSRLLEMIVETGAHVIGARAGALFLLDEDRNELSFEVAIGAKADAVKKFRIPVGHGIAGLVAASGQAIAIAEASSDPRLASDVAESVGYVPQTLLCVPLFYGDRIIGALELLDKEGGRTFSASDMEALALFANQAAVALQLSRTYQDVARLARDSAGEQGEGTPGPPSTAGALAARAEDDIAAQEALELAGLVHEIAREGENERRACLTLLLGFAEYLRTRSRAAGEPEKR